MFFTNGEAKVPFRVHGHIWRPGFRLTAIGKHLHLLTAFPWDSSVRVAEISFPVTNPVFPRSFACSARNNTVSMGVSDLGGGVVTRGVAAGGGEGGGGGEGVGGCACGDGEGVGVLGGVGGGGGLCGSFRDGEELG